MKSFQIKKDRQTLLINVNNKINVTYKHEICEECNKDYEFNEFVDTVISSLDDFSCNISKITPRGEQKLTRDMLIKELELYRE